MNYRYTLGREEYILTPDEHAQIMRGVQMKQVKFVLRGGDLVIDWRSVRTAAPTRELTPEEQRRRDTTLAIESKPETQEDRDKVSRQFCEAHTKKNEAHPAWCICKRKLRP